ncbi:MAG: hypothetical protein QM731_29145 [Chitinophagaceae bacterium]
MSTFNHLVLVLHFIGLGMGLSVSFGNIAMLGVMAKASPTELSVLGRFPPAISKVGRIGLVLLWATGLTMIYTRWNGFGGMPWQFHVKLTAVVLLTIVVVYITRLEGQVHRGDAAAAAKLPTVGKMASLCALTAIIFAVLAFD